jgi:hypothetical protein
MNQGSQTSDRRISLGRNADEKWQACCVPGWVSSLTPASGRRKWFETGSTRSMADGGGHGMLPALSKHRQHDPSGWLDRG